ncbi:xaa-Pro aminopeptidase ApepP-like [Leguminivora glycinivorella]|uniref:xaa-Pro aminopeptidase ApepP-like n=1 Tax=Leguminivora glycinivorella TaxID=1035111 RepID=UPI00200DA2AB|nr:xaa-Pro aminopeptidase ApepP-like [Leguminivora glycinivorella]
MARWPVLLAFCITAEAVWGHILRPGRTISNFEWAEPDEAVYIDDGSGRTTSAKTAAERIAALRAVMEEHNVDAYIVPTADAHNSEYISATDARRVWLSGLTGSSGTAVVTKDHALVWTDGRYFTQFEIQVDTTQWTLMKRGQDLTIQEWLASNLTSGAIVGVDPTTYTRTAWLALQSALTPSGILLQATEDNLVDKARTNVGEPAPARPNNEVFGLPVEYTGKPSNEKISELLAQITAWGATALVLTALDDIAYTLNLRGSDIIHNPVFFAYLVLRADVTTDNIILFWGNGELPAAVSSFLAAEGSTVTTRPYTEIFTYLRELPDTLPEGSTATIWLSQDGSHAIYLAAEAEGKSTTLSTVSPVALMKTVKNEVELKGFRSAHIKDGIAVVRFLRWIHEQVDAGVNVTEVDVGNKLLELRGEEEDFMGASFSTIAGAGENGAIIHYEADPEGPQRVITKDDMLLVDSGGQYKDGTTDITRTRHMGTPTDMQKLTFTRVLKGQILLGTAVFPRGITGNILETLARKALWDVGLDYNHGTGHGVGHFLNVHEGPGGIGSALVPTDPGIFPGMIFSDEPGYYEVNEYGIRHEDVVEVIELTNNSDHIFADGLVGDFEGRGALGFYTISLAPHQTSCLDVSILQDFELAYLNAYHKRVVDTLGPILEARGLTEDAAWLAAECAPIIKG